MQICNKVTSTYLLVFKSKLVLLYELFGQSRRSLNNEAGFQGKKKNISSFFNKTLFFFISFTLVPISLITYLSIGGTF